MNIVYADLNISNDLNDPVRLESIYQLKKDMQPHEMVIELLCCDEGKVGRIFIRGEIQGVYK